MTSVSIIGRASWGAEPALSKEGLYHPIAYVKTVPVPKAKPCFTMAECSKELKGIQHYDMYDGKLQDIKSNFYIGDDGQIYEGRGWFSQPPEHCIQHFSGKYLEVAHIGGQGDKPPSQEFLQAKSKLIEFGIAKKFLNKYHSVI